MTKFLLVRHAHADRAGVVLLGTIPGVLLSAAGRKQAQQLSGIIRGFQPDAVFYSPLERARETAELIGGPLRIAPECRPALREFDFGDWSGKTINDLAAGDPLFGRFNRCRSSATPPDGEPASEVQSRIVGEMDRLRKAYPDGTLVLVTHAEVIRLALAYYAGIPLDLSPRIQVDFASITAISVSEEWIEIPFVNRTAPAAA